MFCLDLLIFIFTVYSIVNTYRMHKKRSFELFPLSINCIATFIITILQLLELSFQFYLATYLIEIYTYLLFSYTFAMLYSRMRQTGTSLIKK